MKPHSIAFTISAREIAYAVFEGQKILFWEVRSFPLGLDADSLDAGFRFERFNFTAAVLSSSGVDVGHPTRSALISLLRKRGIPIFEVAEEDVLASFGLPPPKSQQELLRLVAAVFPQIPFARFAYACLEAAAYGLFFETNRLLSINTSSA